MYTANTPPPPPLGLETHSSPGLYSVLFFPFQVKIFENLIKLDMNRTLSSPKIIIINVWKYLANIFLSSGVISFLEKKVIRLQINWMVIAWAVFTWVSKLICVNFGFAFLRLAIGLRLSRHLRNRSGLSCSKEIQRVENAVHRVNHYPLDKCWQNKLRYPLDSGLSAG